MEPILKFDNVSKHYPNGVHALKGVSFAIREGEFVSVIGPSGSGKSTLLRAINRLIPISGGVAFPFFTFGIKTILLNMLQLGFLLSTLRVGSVVRDKDIVAGPVRPKRRLRISFSWESA